MVKREYRGPARDGTVQYITESPVWGNDGETVAATPDESGTITTENVPDVDDQTTEETEVVDDTPDVDGQTTWTDWEGSA